MSQIHNDSDQLRAFAIQLDGFRKSLEDDLTRLSTALDRLSDTWRDRGFRNFYDEFTKTQTCVKKFVQQANDLTPKLNRDAEALDRISRLQVPK
jgi:uncharacterized protein YukE